MQGNYSPACQHWARVKGLAELTARPFPCLWKCCSTLLTNMCYRCKLTRSSSGDQGFSLALILLNRRDFTFTLLPCVQDLEGMLVFCSHLWWIKVAVWANYPLSILVKKSATGINWSEVMWPSAISLEIYVSVGRRRFALVFCIKNLLNTFARGCEAH